jgi:hypothetical protein
MFLQVILVFASIVVWLIGLAYLTQVTMGVGLVATAVWFALLARLLQETRQHREVLDALGRPNQRTTDYPPT